MLFKAVLFLLKARIIVKIFLTLRLYKQHGKELLTMLYFRKIYKNTPSLNFQPMVDWKGGGEFAMLFTLRLLQR